MHVCVSLTIAIVAWQEALEYVFQQLMKVGFHVLPEPALNKWNSVWPTVCSILTMVSFHGVFLAGMRHACNVYVTDQPDAQHSDSDMDEAVGLLSKSGWLRRDERRQTKALHWIESDLARFACTVMAVLGGIVMNLHFHLFKYCQKSPWGEGRSNIFELCGPRSIARRVVQALWNALETDPPVLKKAFGPRVQWKAKWQQMYRETLLLLMGEITRRVIDVYEAPPYMPLVPLADPEVGVEEKMRLSRWLFTVDADVLDPACKKIRALAGEPNRLLQPRWQSFLFHAMNKLTMSTAAVACLFAGFKQWLAPTKTPSLSMIQAKHVLNAAMQSAKGKELRRQAAIDKGKARRIVQTRPEWIIKRGEAARSTAYSEFLAQEVHTKDLSEGPQAAFARASRAYRTIPQETKAKLASRARARCAMTWAQKSARLQAVCEEDPYADQWPLSPEDLASVMKHKHAIIDHASLWRALATRTKPAVDFPAEVNYKTPLPLPFAGFTEDQLNRAEDIISSLQVFFGIPCAPEPISQPIMITDPAADRVSSLWAVPCSDRHVSRLSSSCSKLRTASDSSPCP